MNVSSRVENLSLINQKLEQLREEFKISKITYEKMLSSVNEAFMNAVDHGNKGDISKIVTFDHRILAEGKIVLTISDEGNGFNRSEEHTSELQSLMRISYAVFCLKKKIYSQQQTQIT